MRPTCSDSSCSSAKISRGALVATLAGNTLEFYDFITYSFFAVYVGRAFFPTDSEFARNAAHSGADM